MTNLVAERLEIVVGDRSAGGAGVVTVKYRRRGAIFGSAAFLAAVLAFAVWAIPGGRLPFWLPMVILLVILGARRRRDRTSLTDPVLADAAVRAALALGTEVKPGRWRISGPAARALGPEFTRLHNWWTPTMGGTSAYRDPVREQLLLGEAKPELRSFMVATIAPGTVAEPLGAEVRSHEPGEPWPVLNPDQPPWPTLPSSGGGAGQP